MAAAARRTPARTGIRSRSRRHASSSPRQHPSQQPESDERQIPPAERREADTQHQARAIDRAQLSPSVRPGAAELFCASRDFVSRSPGTDSGHPGGRRVGPFVGLLVSGRKNVRVVGGPGPLHRPRPPPRETPPDPQPWITAPRWTVCRHRGSRSSSQSGAAAVRAHRTADRWTTAAPHRPARDLECSSSPDFPHGVGRRGAGHQGSGDAVAHPAARQAPRVAAANAARADIALPGVRCRVAARTVSHGFMPVTGLSEPNASRHALGC